MSKRTRSPSTSDPHASASDGLFKRFKELAVASKRGLWRLFASTPKFFFVALEGSQAVKVATAGCDDVSDLIRAIKAELGLEHPPQNITIHVNENCAPLRTGLELRRLCADHAVAGRNDETPLIVKALTGVRPPSIVCPRGETVAMTASCLLAFLERHMRDRSIFNCGQSILGNAGLRFPLFGRQDALKEAANCMAALSKQSGVLTRSDRKIPVCSGLSGLGKTRMLEEWEQIFDLAEIPKTRIGTHVRYYNGHSPHQVESSMTIEASFAWRLLHRCFIENNGDRFQSWFSSILPNNGAELTLELAISVIRQKLINLGKLMPEETLQLFIGIDEYQAINKVRGLPMTEVSLLQDLITVLGDCIASPPFNVRIYPMLAGTDLSALSIPNSSKTFTLRMPMFLLSQADVENITNSIENGDQLLLHAPVRRHLFYIGGVPRWVVEYIQLLDKARKTCNCTILNAKDIEKAYDRVTEIYIDSWGELMRDIDWINLAAYSISRVPVSLDKKKIGGMTWSRVQDSSLCLLNKNRQVLIPYAMIRRVAASDLLAIQDENNRYFVECICDFIEKVDKLVYEKSPWQLWETFGAYFHALRINALLIVGKKVVKVKELFDGALVKGCEQEVVLRPMQVIETIQQFDVNITASVMVKCNSIYKCNWLKKGYVVRNGECGKGVDIFFALKNKSHWGYVGFNDQRKRVAGNDLGLGRCSSLLDKARIFPTIFPRNSSVIACLFSCMTSAAFDLNDVDNNSVVVTRNESPSYHGTLWTHPAASPFVNINIDPITYIRMLLEGGNRNKENLAKKIIERRKSAFFTCFEELTEFVGMQNLVVDVEERVTF